MNPPLDIAITILDQIGGRRFIAMTGASNLVYGNNMLSFRLPGNFAKRKITVVRITLTDADLYDMEFGKIFKGEYKPVDHADGLYFDQLQAVFTDMTGLETQL